MSNRLEDLQRVQAVMLETPSEEKLGLSRAVPYGGAATALAVLCAMTQVATREANAQLAIVGAAIALPLWLVLATIYEFYLFLGPATYEHYRSPIVQSMIKALSYLAGLGLVVSVGGLVHVLLPWALWAFVVACGVAFWFLHKFHMSLAAWFREHRTRQDSSSET